MDFEEQKWEREKCVTESGVDLLSWSVFVGDEGRPSHGLHLVWPVVRRPSVQVFFLK